MKYYVFQKFRFGDSQLIELKAKGLENAIREVFVMNFCDRWSFSLPNIDYDNFNESLMAWVKTLPRFWDFKQISKLIDDNIKNYSNLKECVYSEIRLFDGGAWDSKILRVEEIYSKFNYIEKLGQETILDAILREKTKMNEENEKLEYERLKKKFEENT